MRAVAAQLQSRKSRRRAAGFTLVELMAVVALVTILATLATVGIRKYILSSKTSEPIVMIGAIKAAQEAYRADTFVYKDISGVGALDGYSKFYPATTPLKKGTKVMWGAGEDVVAKGWRELGVSAAGPVMYIYGCAAGPGNVIPASADIPIGNYPPKEATGTPWYLIKAVADLDGDGTVGTFVGTSLTSEIFSHNSNE